MKMMINYNSVVYCLKSAFVVVEIAVFIYIFLLLSIGNEAKEGTHNFFLLKNKNVLVGGVQFFFI